MDWFVVNCFCDVWLLPTPKKRDHENGNSSLNSEWFNLRLWMIHFEFGLCSDCHFFAHSGLKNERHFRMRNGNVAIHYNGKTSEYIVCESRGELDFGMQSYEWYVVCLRACTRCFRKENICKVFIFRIFRFCQSQKKRENACHLEISSFYSTYNGLMKGKLWKFSWTTKCIRRVSEKSKFSKI